MSARSRVLATLVLAACGGGSGGGPRQDAAVDAGPGLPDAAPDCGIDEDDDGVTALACGGRDCDDADPAIHPGADDPGEWTLETADAQGWALHPRIAVGPQGEPHVLYEDRAAGSLRHAFVDQGAWVVEPVQEGGRAGALSVGPEGELHAIYEHGGTLAHATRQGDAWAASDLGLPGRAPSARVDADGTLWIAYLDDLDRSLRVAHGQDGAWEVSAPSRAGFSSTEDGPPSLALAPEGGVQLAFTNDGVLWTAALGPDGWTTEEVAPAGTEVEVPTIAFDPSGAPQIAYHDVGARALDVTVRGPTGWEVDRVDERSDPGAANDLVLDAAGARHLLYQAADTFDVRYATDAYGAWVLQRLDRSGEPGASLALGPDGTLHLSYATTDSDLQYARHVGGNGVDEDCSGMIDG